MEVQIDFTRAQARHPESVQEVVAELAKRMKRAKLPAPHPESLKWSYYWCVQINGGDALDNCFISLEGKLDRRTAYAKISCDVGTPTPRANVPVEVVAVYKKLDEPVTRENVDHVCKYQATDFAGRKKDTLAIAGYRNRQGEIFILSKTVGDPVNNNFHTLTRILGKEMIWSGGLRKKAEERLFQTPPGQDFTYRNRKLTRLHRSEIKSLVQGNTFQLTMHP